MASPIELRIKNIQKNLKVTQTGIFDLETCKAFEAKRALTVTATDLDSHLKEIQKSLGFTGKEVDGNYGPATISRIEMIFDNTVPSLPAGTSMIVSKKGLDIIIESEVSSKAYYNTKYKFPIWPGGDSGVTIGIGYDLGYNSVAKITADFKNLVSAADLAILTSVAGLKAEKAKASLTPAVKAAVVSWEAALDVFYIKSMPDYAKKTKAIYPDVHLLPPDAQAALVSLIYNRGNSLDRPSPEARDEMRNIVPLVTAKDLKGIANEFRKMKRLWDPAKAAGLITRREREAVLIENATWTMPPADYIFI